MTNIDQPQQAAADERGADLDAVKAELRRVHRAVLINTMMLVAALATLFAVLVLVAFTHRDLAGFLHDMRGAFLGK